jgi:hypothetical protein
MASGSKVAHIVGCNGDATKQPLERIRREQYAGVVSCITCGRFVGKRFKAYLPDALRLDPVCTRLYLDSRCCISFLRYLKGRMVPQKHSQNSGMSQGGAFDVVLVWRMFDKPRTVRLLKLWINSM